MRLLTSIIDAILPPLCLSCAERVGEPQALCPSCWNAITFLAPPLCECCGEPFDFGIERGMLCGFCLREPPPWRRSRAVFRYDDASKGLILGLKHADRLDGVPAFGRWLARAGKELLEDADLLTSVPLHPWRLWRRRYNQAALLALALSHEAGKPVDPLLLRRVRWTPSQGQLSRKERGRNVRNAFALGRRKEAALQGKNILLLDDVLTTGATVTECARVLLASGARNVDILALGKVVK